MTEQHPYPAAPAQPGRLHQIDRRTALKAAAGGVVAAAVFDAPRIEGFRITPGYGAMASACIAVSMTAFSGWTLATTGGTWQAGSGNLGYVTNPGSPYVLTNVFHVEADPPAGTYPAAGAEATYTNPTGFTLSAARTFTFTFNYNWRDTNNHVATQTMRAEYATSLSGPWTTGWTFTTSTAGTGDNIHTGLSGSFTITPSVRATYYFRYRASFNGTISTATNQRANDIAITAPSVSCA